MCSFIDYLSLNHIVLCSLILHLIIFLCPPANLNTTCFPSRDPLYCPKVSQIFKECWEELMSFLPRILQIQFVRQSFLFWNQISYFKCHVYSSLIVEMKSERYQFWKRSFKNQAFWSKTQHTSFNAVLWLSCILKTEMAFLMVLYVRFKLWFWVYLLMVCDEVTFLWILKTKWLGFIKKGCFFSYHLFYQHT